MTPDQDRERKPEKIELPASTPWPMIAALGLTLVFAGLVTHIAVSMVGLVIALRGAVGWFCEVFPESKHELVRVDALDLSARPIRTSARTVAHLRAGEAGHRVYIPEKFHPYSSGIKGGIAGGFVMALVACTYGLVAYRSIWYPINLLAAAALPAMTTADLAQLRAFNATAFIVALITHGLISMLVGLLFAVLLPMFPSRLAAFTGSLTSPLFWSALTWATLRLINPALNDRIDWRWFILSQVSFGLTTGYIVQQSRMVETMQSWPLPFRAGIEAPGLVHKKEIE
jgi:hypothetical protein